MILVVLSHPSSGWSMIKFSVMLENFLIPNTNEVRFVRASNILSRKAKSNYWKKILIYLEKKVIFPIFLWCKSKKDTIDFVIVSDHSDAYQTILIPNVYKAIVCHDLFAIQAMLGDIPGIKLSLRESLEIRLNYLSLKKFSKIVSVSYATATLVERYLPGISQKILPLTVIDYKNCESASKMDIETLPKMFCLLPMSSHWRKNRLLGILSWLELKKFSPNMDLNLVIVGNDLTAQELDEVRTSENFNQLTVLRNVSENTLALLYENCEFVIFTSHYEGFGLPIIESNYHGKLALHSDIEVLREVGGDINIPIRADFDSNNWSKMWTQLTDSGKKQRAKDYYEEKYSNEIFTNRLSMIVSEISEDCTLSP